MIQRREIEWQTKTQHIIKLCISRCFTKKLNILKRKSEHPCVSILVAFPENNIVLELTEGRHVVGYLSKYLFFLLACKSGASIGSRSIVVPWTVLLEKRAFSTCLSLLSLLQLLPLLSVVDILVLSEIHSPICLLVCLGGV